MAGLKYRKVFIVLFCMSLLLAMAGGAGVYYLSEKMHMTPTQLAFEKPFGGRDVINILVLGEDETFSKNPEVRGRTDTMILAAVDLKNKRVSAISIPRDTRITMPGTGRTNKINAAYVEGGPQLAAQAVANLLDVDVHYFIKTNIAGLKDTVDLVGGVGIEVEKDMRYTDRRGGLYINLKKGHRHLNGDQALQYVRFRHDRMGDLWRVERQQKFLRALARQITLPENWAKLPEVIDQIMDNVETDLTAKDLLYLARLSKDVPQDEVRTTTLPGVPTDNRGVSYYIADNEAIPQVVDEYLRFQEPKPTVAVLNGNGIAGSAERFAEVLRGAGYRVTNTGNARKMDYQESVVLAADPESAQTQAIADLLKCTPQSLEESAGYDKDAAIVVIIGKNYF